MNTPTHEKSTKRNYNHNRTCVKERGPFEHQINKQNTAQYRLGHINRRRLVCCRVYRFSLFPEGCVFFLLSTWSNRKLWSDKNYCKATTRYFFVLQGLVHELSLVEAHPPLAGLVVLVNAVWQTNSHLLAHLRQVLLQEIYVWQTTDMVSLEEEKKSQDPLMTNQKILAVVFYLRPSCWWGRGRGH